MSQLRESLSEDDNFFSYHLVETNDHSSIKIKETIYSSFKNKNNLIKNNPITYNIDLLDINYFRSLNELCKSFDFDSIICFLKDNQYSDLISIYESNIYNNVEIEDFHDSFFQLLRFYPFLKYKRTSIFYKESSQGFVVNFNAKGSLSLIINKTPDVKFSYAHKRNGSLCRVTGTLKASSNVENTDFINNIINLIDN